MIEVFETWFNQFSKSEQEKLLKHIMKNHTLVSSDYLTCYSEKIDKKRSQPAPTESGRGTRNMKSVPI